MQDRSEILALARSRICNEQRRRRPERQRAGRADHGPNKRHTKFTGNPENKTPCTAQATPTSCQTVTESAPSEHPSDPNSGNFVHGNLATGFALKSDENDVPLKENWTCRPVTFLELVRSLSWISTLAENRRMSSLGAKVGIMWGAQGFPSWRRTQKTHEPNPSQYSCGASQFTDRVRPRGMDVASSEAQVAAATVWHMLGTVAPPQNIEKRITKVSHAGNI